MANRLPHIRDKVTICMICEGNEEYQYMNRLRKLGVWNDCYAFHFINAEGNGNIPARYQDAYQNASYELVLILCDTDRKPYEQYVDIKKKINAVHGSKNAADEVVIFGNPCTMQIISQHWADTMLKSPAKAVNAPLIQEHTGIENYSAHRDQIIELMRYIDEQNYADMKRRLHAMDTDDHVTGSSNFGRFLDEFESDDTKWIDEINHRLELDGS